MPLEDQLQIWDRWTYVPENSNVGRSSLVHTSLFSLAILPCAAMQGATHTHTYTQALQPPCPSSVHIPNKQLLLFHSWGLRMCLLVSSAHREIDKGGSRGDGACLGRRYWVHGLEGVRAETLDGHVLLALWTYLCGRPPAMGIFRMCASWAGAVAMLLSAIFQVKGL